jgi:hypothetical protein
MASTAVMLPNTYDEEMYYFKTIRTVPWDADNGKISSHGS